MNDRWRDSLLVLLPLLVFLVHASFHAGWIIDDAGISFAYARNLATGHGLVSQPGVEPVEGFSNPTWVALYALLNLLGLYHEVWTAKVLGIVFALGTFFLLRQLTSSRAVACLAGSLLALNPSFVIWNQSGLENPLYGFLIVWFAAHCARVVATPGDVSSREISLAVCIASGLAFTRPEGMLFAAAFPVLLLATSKTAAWHPVLVFSSALGVLIGLFLTARYVYFGAWLPNTYLAKGPGTTSLAGLAVLRSALLLVLFLAGATILRRQGSSRRQGTIAALFLAFALALVGFGQQPLLRSVASDFGVLVLATVLTAICLRRSLQPTHTDTTALVFLLFGATAFNALPRDWMGEYRFATPFLPFLFLTLAETVATIPVHRTWTRRASLSSFLILVTAYATTRTTEFARSSTANLRAITAHSQNTLDPIAACLNASHQHSILAADVGGLLLHSELRVYDLGMLCDRRIAETLHRDRLGFYEYVFGEIRPSIIYVHPDWDLGAEFAGDRRFRRDYAAVFEDLERPARTANPSVASGLFVRRDSIAELHTITTIRQKVRRSP